MCAYLACGSRTLVATAAVALALSLAAPVAFAQKGHGGFGHGGSGGNGGSFHFNSGPKNNSVQNFKPISGNLGQSATRSQPVQNFQKFPVSGLGGQHNQNGNHSSNGMKIGGFPKSSGFPTQQHQSPAKILTQKIGGLNNSQHGIQPGNLQKHVGNLQDKLGGGIKSQPFPKLDPHHGQHQHQGNNHDVLGQHKIKMPDQWFGSGKGPIKIQQHLHNGNQHHCKPQFKDCHGHAHQHFCHYHQGFNAWWYRGPSYCNVVAIPVQPAVVGVSGVAAPPVGPPQMILIANVPENGAEVAYLVNGSVVRTAPGSAEPITAATAEIAYDRGGGFGPVTVSLDAGTYEFHRTAEGWQLHRKTFRVAIENRGATDVFRFQADGKPVELPAGTQMQFESNFPLTITFEQNGQPASRQLADGLFMIGPSDTGLLDVLAVTE